jgi:hypothetical protein
MPDVARRMVFLPVPPTADYEHLTRWLRMDEKIRFHHMARTIAALPERAIRAKRLEDLAKRHRPEFMARMRRLVIWYWRAFKRARDEGRPIR